MKEENEHTNGILPDGHLDENSIAEFAEWLCGRADEPDGILSKHLEKCDQCKQHVLEISEIIKEGSSEYETKKTAQELFEETCAAKYSPSIKPGKLNQFWRVAAVLVALITVTSITLILKPGKDNNQLSDNEKGKIEKTQPGVEDQEADRKMADSINTKDTDPIHIESVEADKYAKNYIPNRAFEELIGVQFRAGERPEISIPGKDTSMIVGDVLSFRIINIGKEKLEIQILNNKAELVRKFTDFDDGILKIELEYDPGLYYWKLIGDDELHQVGKFTLKEKDQ